MDLQLALENMVLAVSTVEDLHVVGENIEPGARNFILAFGLGPKGTKRNFGSSRVTYTVTLSFTARKHDLVAIAVKLAEVEAAITADPRRGGNAQTTIFGDEWLPDEQSSREGVTFTNFVGVVIYED